MKASKKNTNTIEPKIILADNEKKMRTDSQKTKRSKHSGKLWKDVNANVKDDLLLALLQDRGFVDDAEKIV